MAKTKSYSVYFAGELFDIKHLAGNAAMKQAIELFSDGKYKCLIPQDFPQTDVSPKSIRDTDILNLLSSDFAVFNFDGAELDSGTVVEFMFAKFADIPAVVLRSDFRAGGDGFGAPDSVAWNLMAAYYPRCVNVVLNSGEIYARSLRGGAKAQKDAECSDSVRAAAETIGYAASKVVDALDQVAGQKPILSGRTKAEVYAWLAKMPDLSPEIRRVLSRRLSKK